MKKIVDASSLNFRSEPKIAQDNRIGVLHLGQSVEIIAEPGGKFVEVQAEIDGVEKTGFVAKKYLRETVSEQREALVGQAIHEWKRFNFGLGKEHTAPFFNFVGEMWQAINLNLDGKDRDVPWSAAAISYMVRNAGDAVPGSKFPNFRFAAAHSRYVHDSIVKRQNDDESAPFWGYELTERHPQLGDIVCRGRSTTDVDFEFASRHDSFKSHCDIIVRIKTDSVITIGGNVNHSVKITEYDKTPDGFLDDTKRVYALLVCNH